jgi:hypothetical protein
MSRSEKYSRVATDFYLSQKRGKGKYDKTLR